MIAYYFFIIWRVMDDAVFVDRVFDLRLSQTHNQFSVERIINKSK